MWTEVGDNGWSDFFSGLGSGLSKSITTTDTASGAIGNVLGGLVNITAPTLLGKALGVTSTTQQQAFGTYGTPQSVYSQYPVYQTLPDGRLAVPSQPTDQMTKYLPWIAAGFGVLLLAMVLKK